MLQKNGFKKWVIVDVVMFTTRRRLFVRSLQCAL